MNRNERRQQRRAVRDKAHTADPEPQRTGANPPREGEDESAREHYRDDGGES
jgi:hypothetical protein